MMGRTRTGPERSGLTRSFPRDTLGLGRMGTRLSDDPTEQAQLLAALIQAGANRVEMGLEEPRPAFERARAAHGEIQNILQAQGEERSIRDQLRRRLDFERSGVGRLLESVGNAVMDRVTLDPGQVQTMDSLRTTQEGISPHFQRLELLLRNLLTGE